MFSNKKKINTDQEAINDLLSRGVVEIVDKPTLEKLLLSGSPLRIKLGIDPTSPNIHLGRAVVLRKLRAFQDLGHTVVFIVGDFTGVIGDTSDKDSERPMLTQEDIKANIKGYFKQAGLVIDLKKAETYYNSSWLSKLTYREIGEQANKFSVSDFIARENIKRRLDAGTRVSLREVLYPLMQGYDSVAIRADVELGGTDQKFNLLAGRRMQDGYKQRPQQIMTTRLLMGLDGRKMSSSWGNGINLTDDAKTMYGKVMSVRDELIWDYFELATDTPLSEIGLMRQEVENGENPMKAKKILAKTITTLYHGEAEALKEEEQFGKAFSNKEAPDDVVSVEFKEGTLLSDILTSSGTVVSKSDFQRLIKAGAVEELTVGVVEDVKAEAHENIYRIGKHRFVKLVKGK